MRAFLSLLFGFVAVVLIVFAAEGAINPFPMHPVLRTNWVVSLFLVSLVAMYLAALFGYGGDKDQ